MAASVAFSPYVTTNARGTFNISSEGYVQGMLLDNPVEQFHIAGGVVALTETLPMWGGLAITERVPAMGAGDPMDELGGYVARASTIANITGFTVLNQAHHMIITPQSGAPVAPAGSSIHFVRLGSNCRLAVACDPSLASLENAAINSQVSWDFNAGVLQPYDASTATVAISSATWTNTAGGRLTVVAGAPVVAGAVGDFVTISGATNSGTGGAAAINRTFVVDTWTDSTHFTLAAPAAAGVIGTVGGSPVVAEGIGALPVRVIGFNFGNSITTLYDPSTGFANWNRSGSTAIILI